ncbi:hypothetical protein BDN72DRAFT_487042 [Pluteus cervinus]|uniref:Uncharacterized protein n=1 Tax=Pluteus cervinus TaxID=181527 RepID=A0ACD3AZW5_9AGAR|nr:hypothetical protein BDN72DRAFT_487042 [Pluteus cervinus]
MNNLIRTLTESHVKDAFPDTDLKLLLTTVKEGRRQSHDAKLSDPFYDALEGLLSDLKTITIDNRDAEAFLKPVSKAEVADYYDVIQTPMDFQTMLKKVKQKQYKSKREFEDDLDLIWSNCNTYNAAENHPLRQCVKRLKVKAGALLKHITDRKDRTDPSIPQELAQNPSRTGSSRGVNGINGYLNGYTHGSHQRSPSYPTTIKHTPSSVGNVARKRMNDLPFAEAPAIVRTPQGMMNFWELDRQLAQIAAGEVAGVGAAGGKAALAQKLHELAPPFEMDVEDSANDMSMAVDGPTGEKRKLNGVDHRPRKRTRLGLPYPLPVPTEREQLSELWWAAVQSDSLLANGLPEIPFASSSAVAPTSPSSVTLTTHPQHSGSLSASRLSKGKKKKRTQEEKPKALLTLMNNNIKTMKRVRHTHAKFAALGITAVKDDEGAEGGIDGASGMGGLALPGTGYGGGGLVGSSQPGSSTAVGGSIGPSAFDEDSVGALDERVDERPWRIRGKGKQRAGIEIGEKNAEDCVKWMDQKVLEHSGFQGASKMALDVLASVTTDYLYNVGRTLRFLSDKYAQTMTPEEIILHTLFESGTAKIQDMERYITDDIQRHGSRLTDLEKKLVSAYHESTASEVFDEEGLFESEDEETMAMGEFADLLGEDYLGLRELGIAAELGMSSVSIPKKLLRKKGNQKSASAAAKPKEPPPPYPPPAPLLPLTSSKVDDQIGLLKHYYQCRFAALAVAAQPSGNGALGSSQTPGPGVPPTLSMPPLPGPSFPPLPGPRIGTPLVIDNIKMESTPTPFQGMGAGIGAGMGEMQVLPQVDLVLPDDVPSTVQMKMGPLGQIVKGGGGSGPAKKKASNKSGGATGPAPPGGGSGGGSGALGASGGEASSTARETTAPPVLPITASTSMSGSTVVAVTPGPSGMIGVAVNGDLAKKSKKGAMGVGTGKKKKGGEMGAMAIAPSRSGSGQPPVIQVSGIVVPSG